MFGYIVCNRKELTKEEQSRYQSVYCGVCNSIGKKFGQISRISVSYDMTFLALFLSALYDPQEESFDFRCPVHPLKKRMAVKNKYIDYATDMTIVLTYYKCIDDWEDERKTISKKYADLLKDKFLEVAKRYPRQCSNVSACIHELSMLEKSSSSIPDDAINCSGRMLSEIFVMEEDFWSDSLRQFGYELGRFIYLMDASMDYEKDLKKMNYNPVHKLKMRPEDMELIMTGMIGNACREFEKLPITEDSQIIRNILYGGVWQQYYAKYHRRENEK